MASSRQAISVQNTMLLITNAGGRCSFNHNGVYCNKILADGRVNLGERAHIIGVNGPRALDAPIEDKNSYDNLIWLCQEHHKIIDDRSTLHDFTVNILKDMKNRHENKIKSGRYPFYGTESAMHDYAVLSCLFYFLNIHTLYSNVSSFPSIHIDFYDVSDMLDTYKENNPNDFPLKDLILRKIFNDFERAHQSLYWCIKNQCNLISNNAQGSGYLMYNWSVYGEQRVLHYLFAVENLIELIQRRFPQILHQEIYKAF